MSSTTRKDKILALLLAGLVIAALWRTLYAPLIEQKESVQRQKAEMSAKITQIETAMKQSQAASSRIKDELTHAVTDGYVSKVSSLAAADDQLQSIVKYAAEQANANILQLRPLAAEQSSILKRAQLTVDLRIASGQIDTLLSILAQSVPRLSVDTMVLRQPSQAGSSDQLEGNITVALWYSSEQFTDAPGVYNAAPQFLNANSASLSSITPIDTLFNRELRERMLNPALDRYRLAAITASSDARIAVITDRQTNQSHRLTVGDYLDTFKVTAIESERVVFKGKESTESLSLQNSASQ